METYATYIGCILREHNTINIHEIDDAAAAVATAVDDDDNINARLR